MTANELIKERILPITETLVKKVEELEENQKKIVQEVNRHWRFMNLLLPLQLLLLIIVLAK